MKNAEPRSGGSTGKPLDGIVRARENVSWGKARKLIETGKISVDGQVVTDPERRVRDGAEIVVDMRARNTAKGAAGRLGDDRIVFCDTHVVVVNKPSGVSTVPYEPTDEGTLDEQVRHYLSRRSPAGDRGKRPALGVVHRIDKETSGLVVFTRSWLAKESLAGQFRAHTVHRRYLAIVHGQMQSRKIESHLIADRGDGLRGSIERMRGKKPPLSTGQRAVTHVHVEEQLANATLVSCELETGRTHQIRIHLSESGHPLVGERVYVRGYPEEERIPAPRLMLHAAELGFVHPKTERLVKFSVEPPDDFAATLQRLHLR